MLTPGKIVQHDLGSVLSEIANEFEDESPHLPEDLSIPMFNTPKLHLNRNMTSYEPATEMESLETPKMLRRHGGKVILGSNICSKAQLPPLPHEYTSRQADTLVLASLQTTQQTR